MGGRGTTTFLAPNDCFLLSNFLSSNSLARFRNVDLNVIEFSNKRNKARENRELALVGEKGFTSPIKKQ